MINQDTLLKATEQSTDFVVQGIVRPTLLELQRLQRENEKLTQQRELLRGIFKDCYLQQDPTTGSTTLHLPSAKQSFMDMRSLSQAVEQIIGVRYNAPF